ncbi:DUF2946 domain-containing protein [Paucibacter sp. JuS9]|uniref:DUF2946 domain-containing protein n=1 Tax=Roseateles TaxID=93681 RepID=UPI002FE5AA0B
MRLSRSLRALISWLACCAILLTALAPAISHAVQSDVPDGWTEICSVTGAKLVRIADGETRAKPGPADSGLHVYGHCPYCALHVDVLGLPPAATAEPALLPLTFEVPELFLLAPRTLHAWATAQPRAPPLSS